MNRLVKYRIIKPLGTPYSVTSERALQNTITCSRAMAINALEGAHLCAMRGRKGLARQLIKNCKEHRIFATELGHTIP